MGSRAVSSRRHAEPLSALARQHKRDLGRCGVVSDALGRGRLAGRKASQHIGHGRAVFCNKNRTMIERGPTRGRIPANVVERGSAVIGEQVGVELRQRAQRLRAFRREGKQLRLSTARGRDPSASPGACSSTTWQFVPPIPKALTPAIRGPSRGQSWWARGNSARRVGPRNCGIKLPAMKAGGNRAEMHRKRCLDKPGDACGGLRVTDIGLYRADTDGIPGARPSPSTRRARKALSGRRCACRCHGLRHSDLSGSHASILIGCRSNSFCLFGRGHHPAAAAAVVVDRAAPDDAYTGRRPRWRRRAV